MSLTHLPGPGTPFSPIGLHCPAKTAFYLVLCVLFCPVWLSSLGYLSFLKKKQRWSRGGAHRIEGREIVVGMYYMRKIICFQLKAKEGRKTSMKFSKDILKKIKIYILKRQNSKNNPEIFLQFPMEHFK